MVRQLVDAQFPQWAGRPVRAVASPGTVNAIFRIGDDVVARFPLQPAEVETTRRCLRREAAAARELAGVTRFATPQPVAIGEPGAGYPLPWTVNTWLSGTAAATQDPSRSDFYARDLAEFIQSLRSIDTHGRTFDGNNRGGDLSRGPPSAYPCSGPKAGLCFHFRGGRGRQPDLLNNIVAHPADLTVEIGTDTVQADAEVLPEPMRSQVFDVQATRYPGFAAYQANTARVILVVALTLHG